PTARVYHALLRPITTARIVGGPGGRSGLPGAPGAVSEADRPAMSFTASRRLTFVGLAADARTVLGVDTADVRETLRLTVAFGIARCLAAAVKLPVSATAAKTTIAFRSGPWCPTVLFLEQSFQESYSGPISRTMADLAHDTHALDGGDRLRGPHLRAVPAARDVRGGLPLRAGRDPRRVGPARRYGRGDR